MAVPTEILPPHPDGDDLVCLDALIDPGPAPARPVRADGWTAERQRKFLEMLAEGHTITNACLALGMSVTSAYTLRRSARGAAFALGWQAALLLARDHLADKLLERAVHGSVETITHADGSTVTRQRHDNRLAMHMLTRLDRLADSAHGAADHAAARLAAAEFAQYLDLVERDGGAARAGLFLARRLAEDADGAEAATDALAPVRALARADAWLRGRVDAGEAVAIGDLDPARRAGWTAEQWARAEAAGLLVLAPPPAAAADDEPAHEPKLPQFRDPDNPDGNPVWWSNVWNDWRTSFPPDDEFCGEEELEYGDPDYSRELGDREREAIEGPLRIARAARQAEAAAARDAFFADTIEVVEVPARIDPRSGGVAAARAVDPGPCGGPPARPKRAGKARAKPARRGSSGGHRRAQSGGAALHSGGQAPT